MNVFLSDMGKISDHYLSLIEKYDIEFEQGQHTEQKILQADEVIKSPGIPPTAPIVRLIVSKNIPVISEIEFAGRYTDARMVCITGSNGKTTTTMLTYHILKEAGLNVGLAGNVGQSLAFQVATTDHDVYVIELSSFQLENMYKFKANIAVIMNITPDHLDRYDYNFQNYVDAKFRILQNQSADDAFIFWQDDPVIKQQLRHLDIAAKPYPFAEHREENTASYIDAEDRLILETPRGEMSMPRADLALNGLHNLFNSMAAGLSASLLDVKKEDIRKSLSDFEGVEHRLEYVATVDGVRYINDSKATNVNSCWYALESMSPDTILILGGKDKGNDYSEIDELVSRKVKAIVAMGLHNEKIIDHFRDKVDVIVDTHSIGECVAECRRLASPGDTVLLSPCCASFDLFTSYEDRGRQFKNEVKKLSNPSL